ncbi:hypothetical protein QVD17_33421 [Tagetes erecta]|uniref:Dof-type domain-containing protein n=1 Tax=Tagetes erecta TaxID=13708 RepID=A0AAD8NL35_TARER|nr:hypothetical protein QVD17_33421 [Tagetes erecta]
MADVHTGDDSTRIKLFGKTINVHAIHELKEEPVNKSDVEDDDDDHHQTLANKRPDMIMQCPRCKSMETKFCYFNNYNVNQPRHFCKGCHRYWTAGGALRNVPVGAGRRKAKHGLLDNSYQHLFPVKRRRNFNSGGVTFD